MCGFAGFYDSGLHVPSKDWERLLMGMGSLLQHRGPDDQGIWCDVEAGIGVIHRRLSILDLSKAGRQPMTSRSGRYVIAFNGEIYNHAELRRRQGRHPWVGNSDTETLLELIESGGLEQALIQTVGMFALALWDRHNMELTLARDRMGEKPLYYGWHAASSGQRVFLFGSETKALRYHPAFDSSISQDGLTRFIERGYVGPTQSIYQRLQKVPPGCYVTLRFSGKNLSDAAPVSYWSLDSAVSSGRANPFVGTFQDATDRLDELLTQAIRDQQLADVPVGAFLSGGIDSSLIVSLMQKQSERPVKTFTIGFSDTRWNEATYAKAVANHLRTDHHELYLSASHAIDIVPSLSAVWDEPFSDPSQIPTLLVSSLAKKHVTVSLSGDGGDELFGGYSRYFYTNKIWRLLRCLPVRLRRVISKAFARFDPDVIRPIIKWLPQSLQQTLTPDRVARGIDLIGRETASSVYRNTLSIFYRPEDILLNPCRLGDLSMPAGLNLTDQMRFEDLTNYLVGDILEKVDRAAMACGLESRVPFLDHRIVEFAWSLPSAFLMDSSLGKKPLRALLSRHVPKELFDRPKQGFGVPLDEWLRGPLRDWAASLLDDQKLSHEGSFRANAVKSLWHQHLQTERNWAYQLWNILMFISWRDYTTTFERFSPSI